MNVMRQIRNANAKEISLGLEYGRGSWHDAYQDSAYIFVGGLPLDLNEGDVVCIFSQYGEIVDCNLIRDKGTGKSKGFAFIAYEDQRSTVLAVDNFNGAKILGRVLRVDHVEKYKIPKSKQNSDSNRLGSSSTAAESLDPTSSLTDPEVIYKNEGGGLTDLTPLQKRMVQAKLLREAAGLPIDGKNAKETNGDKTKGEEDEEGDHPFYVRERPSSNVDTRKEQAMHDKVEDTDTEIESNKNNHKNKNSSRHESGNRKRRGGADEEGGEEDLADEKEDEGASNRKRRKREDDKDDHSSEEGEEKNDESGGEDARRRHHRHDHHRHHRRRPHHRHHRHHSKSPDRKNQPKSEGDDNRYNSEEEKGNSAIRSPQRNLPSVSSLSSTLSSTATGYTGNPILMKQLAKMK